MTLGALPEHARPRPGETSGPRLLARSDSAGTTHTFAPACREKRGRFSFGFPVASRIKDIVDVIPEQCWHPAIETDGLREGAWVTEATDTANLVAWSPGSRLILQLRDPGRQHPDRPGPTGPLGDDRRRYRRCRLQQLSDARLDRVHDRPRRLPLVLRCRI